MVEMIRKMREQLRMSRRQLAERARLHPSTIWSVENGLKAPRRWTIVAIAHALGVDPEWLCREYYRAASTERRRGR